MHGLTTKPTSTNLRRQKIIVKSDGVFPLFYHQITGTRIAGDSSLKVIDMFGYSSDVGYEFEQLKYGTMALFRTRFAIGMNENTKTAFPIIAVLGVLGRDFNPIRVKLTKTFDQVNLHQLHAREIFQIVNPERQHCEFFESKQEYPFTASNVASDMISSMGELVSYWPFADDVLFVLNKPIRATPPENQHRLASDGVDDLTKLLVMKHEVDGGSRPTTAITRRETFVVWQFTPHSAEAWNHRTAPRGTKCGIV